MARIWAPSWMEDRGNFLAADDAEVLPDSHYTMHPRTLLILVEA